MLRPIKVGPATPADAPMLRPKPDDVQACPARLRPAKVVFRPERDDAKRPTQTKRGRVGAYISARPICESILLAEEPGLCTIPKKSDVFCDGI